MPPLTDPAALWAQTSFCTCAYLSEHSGVRRRLVRRALTTWTPLLDLPFNERVFIDDHSPGQGALQVLEASGLRERFEHATYAVEAHPPHSNFGIVASYAAARGPFVVHLDDDVQVRGTPENLRKFLESALAILASDERILGINILTLPSDAAEDYVPAQPAAAHPGYAHPVRYFGTAASIIRQSLLDRVSSADIRGYGAQQPAFWEVLVSTGEGRGVGDFLVAPQPTPFVIPKDAWLFSSTAKVSWLGAAKYFLLKRLGRA